MSKFTGCVYSIPEEKVRVDVCARGEIEDADGRLSPTDARDLARLLTEAADEIDEAKAEKEAAAKKAAEDALFVPGTVIQDANGSGFYVVLGEEAPYRTGETNIARLETNGYLCWDRRSYWEGASRGCRFVPATLGIFTLTRDGLLTT